MPPIFGGFLFICAFLCFAMTNNYPYLPEGQISRRRHITVEDNITAKAISLPHGAHCAVEIALSGAIMLTLMLVCAFSPRKYKSILRGFYNAVSVPGDSHASLGMTECVAAGNINKKPLAMARGFQTENYC